MSTPNNTRDALVTECKRLIEDCQDTWHDYKDALRIDVAGCIVEAVNAHNRAEAALHTAIDRLAALADDRAAGQGVAPVVNLKDDGSVRRFFINPENGHLVETARGPWVRYVDHKAALAAQPEPIAAEPVPDWPREVQPDGSVNAVDPDDLPADRAALATTARVKAIHWREALADGSNLAAGYWREFTEAVQALAAAPEAPAQPGQGEPVAWRIDWPDEPELGHMFSEEPSASGRSTPLYTATPARKRVTEAEIAELVGNWFAEEWAQEKARGLLDDFARAIDAARITKPEA